MHRRLLNLFLSSSSDNRKPVVSNVEPSKIDNRKLVAIFALVLTFVMCGAVAQGQQPKKVPRIGILPSSATSPATPQNEAFLQGLRELGYVEGKTILIEYRFPGEKIERLSDLAAELVRLKVDIIVVSGGRAAWAAKNATATIPIVVAGSGDLVAAGLVASLAKPGGNVTGFTGSSADASGKRLGLLRELLPKATRVAVLWHPNPGDRPGGMTTDWDEVKETETASVGRESSTRRGKRS